MAIKDFFTHDDRFDRFRWHPFTFELVGLAYAFFTIILIAFNLSEFADFKSMMALRVFYIEATVAAFIIYFIQSKSVDTVYTEKLSVIVAEDRIDLSLKRRIVLKV